MAKWSEDELKVKLRQQLSFIDRSIACFRQHEDEAVRVSTIVRILIEDGQTPALLTHLKVKDRIKYIDSSIKPGSISHFHSRGNVSVSITGINSRTPFVGLLAKLVEEKEGIIEINYKPIYDYQSGNSFPQIDFNQWWQMTVFDNHKGLSLSREELILQVANMDGGAHVGEKINNRLEEFKNSSLLTFNLQGTQTGLDNIPLYPAIMQIAWELKLSIENYLNK